MADPWAQFVAPAPAPAVSAAPDPWAQFAPPATAPAATKPTPPTTPLVNLNPFSGQPDKVGEFIKAAIDASTGGLVDPLQGQVNRLIGGPDTAALRAQTEAGRQDIGPLPSAAADIAGYALGPGKFGAGARVAEKMGGSLAARMLGSAAEGAGASAIGTAGHGDTNIGDLLKSAAMGGVIGGATGVLPAGRGMVAAQAPRANQALWSQLEKAPLRGTQVQKTINNTSASLTAGEEASIPLDGMFAKQLAKIQQSLVPRNQVSGDDIAKMQRLLMRSARGDTQQRIAGKYITALDQQLGPLAQTAAEANRQTGVYKTGQDIAGWAADPATAPAEIKKALTETPQFYNRNPELFNALTDVAKPPSWGRTLVNEAVGRGLSAAAGGLAGYGAEQLTGGGPAVPITSGVLAGAFGHGMTGLGNAAIRNRLLAAQHLNATGQAIPASAFGYGPLGLAGQGARTIGYGLGSAGAY